MDRAPVSGICLTEEDGGRLQAIEIPEEFRGETTYGVVVRRDKYVTAALRGLLDIIGVNIGPTPEKGSRNSAGRTFDLSGINAPAVKD